MRKLMVLGALAVVGCGEGDKTAAPLGPPPASTAATSSTATDLTILATDQFRPWTLAIDDTNLYWVNAGTLGGVYKVAKSGGVPQELYAGQVGNVESLGLDAASIYVPLGETIAAIPKNGGPPLTVASGTRTGAVAVANGDVYWVPLFREPAARPKMLKASVAGGQVAEIALPDDAAVAPSAYFIRAANDGVYASLLPGGGIVRVPLDQSPPTLLPLREARDMAFDADRIYFTGGDTVSAVAKGGGSPNALTPIPAPMGVAADDNFLYFTDSQPDGRVLKMPKSGGAPQVLAEHQGAPHAIAVDATSVYWNCVNEGTIKRMNK